MKSILALCLGIFVLSACSSTIKFPVSKITPAADIQASKHKDKNGNLKITVVAENLSSADRLNPPRKVYVVWVSTAQNGTKNIGQLKIKNAKKATLETVTPFDPQEIFITAEDDGNISYASGPEIARVSLNGSR